MTKRVKAIGLALVAAFAMSAVLASAAQATNDVIRTHTGEPVELTAEALSTQEFRVDEGTDYTKCSEVQVDEATVKDGASSITVTPTYNKEENTCETSLGNARITTRGCHYLFTGETKETNEDGKEHAAVDIQCPEGISGITIDAPLGCSITVPPQTVWGVRYENKGETPKEDIVLKATVSGIEYNVNFICLLGGVNDKDDGTYTGEVTVTGWEDDQEPGSHGVNQVGISYETAE